MGISVGPLVPRDGMLLWYDFSTAKSFRGQPTTNFYTNGHFSGGTGVTQESGSNPTNTVIALPNPGASSYVLEQSMGSAFTEYQINLTTELTSSTTYCMSGWYAESSDYSCTDGSRMFHCRAFSTSGNHVALGLGIGTVVETRFVGGLLWKYCFTTITTPSDYNNTFNWYLGYGNNSYTGKRYYTNIQMEVGSYPRAFVNGTRGTTVAAGGGVVDLSGRGNSGELLNGPTASYLYGGEVMFDGTNDHIRIPSISATSVSVGAWVRSSSWSTQGHPMIVAKGINTEWILWKSDDAGNDENFGWRSSNNSTIYSTTNAQNNVWYHLMATVGAAGQRLYVNGVLEASNGTTAVPSGSLDICVGAGIINGSPNNFLLGSVRGVQIWNRQLSAVEVLQNYNSSRSALVEKISPVTSNLILHLDAANRDSYRGTGTTWTDLSGYGYNGTLNNGPVYRSTNGGGITFDGSNDSVTTGLTGSVVDLTVDCWFIGTNTGRNHLWDMGSYTGQPSDTNLNFNFNDSGYDLWIYWNGGGTNRLRYMVDGSFTDGRPKHMVFTHTGSTNKTYLNGVELTVTESGGTQTFNAVNSTPGNGFRLGGLVAFSGTIFSARVYSSALTATEVLQNFNAGRRRFGL
jgi:hypothetical protein